MNVTCPDCRTVYRVDPRKIPTGGIIARCARCPAEFPVENEAELIPDASSAQAFVDPAPVGEIGGRMEDLEPTVAEGLVASEPTIEHSVAEGVDWVEPTAAEMTEPPSAEIDRSWLVQGSAWVEEISARMDEPAPAEVEASEDASSADPGTSAVSLEHDEGSISVSIDYNPDAAGFSDPEASSDEQVAGQQAEALAAAGSETQATEYGSEERAGDRDESHDTEEARYEEAVQEVVYDAGESGEGSVAGAFVGEAEAEVQDADAPSHESEYEATPSAHEAVPAFSGSNYNGYQASPSDENGHEGGSPSLDGGSDEQPVAEAAPYDSGAEVVGDAGTSDGSAELEEVHADSAGQESAEYGEADHVHTGESGEREGGWAAVGSDASSEYSAPDESERVEVGVIGEVAREGAREDHEYAAVASDRSLDPPAAEDDRSSVVLAGAMPDPPRQDSAPSDPWAGSRSEMPRGDEVPEAPAGIARDREAVLVSASAGSLDGVAGVEGTPGGEGFTTVPPRSDQDIALPPPPFGSSDPHARAKRLARALVSDIVVYNPDRRERSIRMGTIRQEFREEIRKSWEEYVAHVGNQMARDTSYFRDALNELLAGGNRLF